MDGRAKRARQAKARQAARRIEISAVLIAKDEAEHIADLAASLDGAVDEVVLLDTGSTDDTVALAEAHGFRVFHRPWTDHFADARNAALAHARGKWVLSIDADERLVTSDRDELRQLTRAASNATGAGYATMLWVAVESFTGDDLDPTTSDLAQQVRLFRLSRFHYEGRIHEQVIANQPGHEPPAAHTPNSLRLQHLGYTPTIWSKKNKTARNNALVKAAAAETTQTRTDDDAAAGYAKYEQARLIMPNAPEAGLALMLEALASFPNDRDTHRNGSAMAARALIDAGRCDEALECLARASRNEAFATQFDVITATAFARSGRDDDAKAMLRQIEAGRNDYSSNSDMLVRMPALKAELLAISGRPLESWQALVGLNDRPRNGLNATARGIANRAWNLAAAAGTPDRYLDELSKATDDDEFRAIQPLLGEAHERAALGARHVLTREPIVEPDPRMDGYRPKLAGYSASAVISLAQARLDTEPALALGVAQTIEDRPNATERERDAARLVAIRALLLLNHVEAAVRLAAELPDDDIRLNVDKDFLATVIPMARALQVNAGAVA